jgi:hypothetical protein
MGEKISGIVADMAGEGNRQKNTHLTGQAGYSVFCCQPSPLPRKPRSRFPVENPEISLRDSKGGLSAAVAFFVFRQPAHEHSAQCGETALTGRW